MRKKLLIIFFTAILNTMLASSVYADTIQNSDGSFTYTQTVDENSPAPYYTLPSNGGGFEIYSWYNQDYGWMHDFQDWNTPGLVIQSAKLDVHAWDIDSEVTWGTDGEYDGVSVDNVMLNPGYLQGLNEEWSNTTFDIPVNDIMNDGKINVDLDIDMTHQFENWATTLDYSKLTINYVIDNSNNPPYQPEITPSGQIPVDKDIVVDVTGPNPADPDGDQVHYEYRWFVDIGNGFFIDDEFAGRNDHTGNIVTASDIRIGDKWRVQVTPIDEHNAVGPYTNSTWEVVDNPIQPLQGRMTGGGNVYTEDGMKVTHGFTLFNTIEKKSNNIQVNWGKGNKFHLDALKEISYVSLNNGVIAKGKGIGDFNGMEGASIEFTFSDFGNPGTEDFTKIVIKDKNNNEVLNVENNLNHGNDKYHQQ